MCDLSVFVASSGVPAGLPLYIRGASTSGVYSSTSSCNHKAENTQLQRPSENSVDFARTASALPVVRCRSYQVSHNSRSRRTLKAFAAVTPTLDDVVVVGLSIVLLLLLSRRSYPFSSTRLSERRLEEAVKASRCLISVFDAGIVIFNQSASLDVSLTICPPLPAPLMPFSVFVQSIFDSRSMFVFRVDGSFPA